MSIRVLIVDDNEVFRRPLQRTLEAGGYEVVAVPSGEDALQVLDRSPVDVVLTDCRLPGMDGVHLTGRIRAIHPARGRWTISKNPSRCWSSCVPFTGPSGSSRRQRVTTNGSS